MTEIPKQPREWHREDLTTFMMIANFVLFGAIIRTLNMQERVQIYPPKTGGRR